MKQRILHTNVVPPGGWKAKCPHCGQAIWAPTYQDFCEWIEKHNAANGHEAWDYITQLCESLPPGHCMMEDGSPGVGAFCEMRASDMLAGAGAVAKLLTDWALGREVFVDQAEAERRAAICTRCPKNVHASGCGGCATMQSARALVAKTKGDRKTSADPYLQQCCVCGCDLSTIVHVRHDILMRGFTDHQRHLTAQTVPACWKLERPTTS